MKDWRCHIHAITTVNTETCIHTNADQPPTVYNAAATNDAQL